MVLATQVHDVPVVWAPLPGSQRLFLSCPIFEVLFHGTRGPGKTDSLIMDYAQFVGRGWGEAWRGIIFRKTYKQLDDVVAKTHKWFKRIFPKAKFNKSSYEWTFPTGEALLLRYMDDPNDYWNYHGHEYCLAVGQRVSTPGGLVAIEDIRAGDMVDTPLGPRRVTWVSPRRVRPCHAVDVYDSDGRLVGRQVQSEEHHLLTNAGWKPLGSSCSCQNALQHSQAETQLGEVRTPQHGAHQGSTVACGHALCPLPSAQAPCEASQVTCHSAQQPQPCPLSRQGAEHGPCAGQGTPDGGACSAEGAESGGVWFRCCTQGAQQHHQGQGAELHRAHHPRQAESRQPLPTGCHELCKSCALLQKKGEGLQCARSGQQQQPAQGQCGPHCTQKSAGPCAPRVICEAQDCISGCHTACGSCGAPPRTGTESGLWPVQLPPCAQEVLLVGQRTDASEGEGAHSHHHQCASYIHPYTGQPQESALPFHRGFVVFRPCGPLETIDIEVEEANSYITEIGLVNKNCYIGWEELTNWHDAECYLSMFACCRSSTQGIQRRYRATCNPYGVGHNWVKARFIDVAPPGVPYTDPVSGKQRVHLFGSIYENTILMEADPDYMKNIEAIEDPHKRRAWLYGDWDIVAGAMFGDCWRKDVHILKPFTVPRTWRVDRSFDWGSSRPFSVGWWAESDGSEVEVAPGVRRTFPRGSLFRVAEYYGWNGKPNEGTRMLAADVARRIREIEAGFEFQVYPGPADTSIFDVLNGNSIADDMQRMGVRWERADKSPGSRKQGWERMRRMMTAAKEGRPDEPHLYTFDTCRHFIRTVPSLPMDEKHIDDIDTDAEDHVADEARYRVLAAKRENKPFNPYG